MSPWTGIVLALPSTRDDAMVSRLPTYLHPIAGRPLVWHALSALTETAVPPGRLLVISEGDLSDDLFQDISLPVEAITVPEAEERPRTVLQPLDGEQPCVVVHASAVPSLRSVETALRADPGAWLPGAEDLAAVVRSDPEHLSRLLRLPDPFEVPNGAVSATDRIDAPEFEPLVTDRALLASVTERVRRRLIDGLMTSGVSFLLPDTVVVDVDVRVGRDSIIYPGVVLEGTTTVGEETVIGPGCRIIDSWVGSGVELRGWNYISHTSIRNRAILEPYVRRGFD